MYLFFDTETTGLPKNWRAPVTDLNNWPRIVQLAWQVYENNGELVLSRDYIIKPQGFIIPEAASRVHGITTERALSEGVELKEVLYEFADCLSVAHYLIAHNIDFDEKITGAEFLRTGIPYDLFSLPKICTMQSSIELCNIPGAYGPKWPSLMELHQCLFGKGFEDAHDALVDVEACARSFFELKSRGVVRVDS